MAEASYNFIYARSPQTRVGVEGFSLHFLSGCEFYPPKTRFFPAPFLCQPWMLCKEGCFFPRAYPSAVWRWAGLNFPPLLRLKKRVFRSAVCHLSCAPSISVAACFLFFPRISAKRNFGEVVNVRNKFLKEAWWTNLTNVSRVYNFINILIVCVVWYVYGIHG